MRKIYKALSLAVAAVLTVLGPAGCRRSQRPAPADTSETAAKQTEAMTAAAKGAAPGETSEAETRTHEGRWEYRKATLSLLTDSNVALDGLQAVCDLAEKELGIAVEIKYKVDDRPFGIQFRLPFKGHESFGVSYGPDRPVLYGQV